MLKELTLAQNKDRLCRILEITDQGVRKSTCIQFGNCHTQFEDKGIIWVRALNNELVEADPHLRKKFYAMTVRSNGKVHILVPRLTMGITYDEPQFVERVKAVVSLSALL